MDQQAVHESLVVASQDQHGLLFFYVLKPGLVPFMVCALNSWTVIHLATLLERPAQTNINSILD